MKSLLFISIGRVSLVLSIIALVGAWITQLSGNSIIGMSQIHLFNDATVLALLGIGFLLDGQIHKGKEKPKA